MLVTEKGGWTPTPETLLLLVFTPGVENLRSSNPGAIENGLLVKTSYNRRPFTAHVQGSPLVRELDPGINHRYPGQ